MDCQSDAYMEDDGPEVDGLVLTIGFEGYLGSMARGLCMVTMVD